MNDFMNALKPMIINVSFFFALYLIGHSVYLFFSLVLGTKKEYQYYKGLKLKSRLKEEDYAPISILVPIRNQEEKVLECIRSLLALDDRLYEIIMIDDGSDDSTLKTLMSAFSLKKIKRPLRIQIPTADVKNIYQTKKQKVKITLIEKEKSGRADTLNVGLNAADYPYFIVVDTNYILKEDTLEHISYPVLEGENVVVCSGSVKLTTKNDPKQFPSRGIPGCRALEYNNLTCAKENELNVLSGAFEYSASLDLFQKETAISVGGYSGEGDNFNLKRNIYAFCQNKKEEAKLSSAPTAICSVQVESGITSYLREEKKFIKSKRRTLLKHKKAFFSTDHILLPILSLIYSIIYQFFAPFMELLGALSLVLVCAFNLVEIKSIILFLSSVILFYSTLTFCTFLMRMRMEEERKSFLEWGRIYLLCIYETTVFKVYKLIAQITSFFPKKEH